MTTVPTSSTRSSDFPACKVIYCVVPDDGTDKRVLAELRKTRGIIRAGSSSRRSIGALGDVRVDHGKLPQPELVKQFYVLCPEDIADEVFDWLFWAARIDKPHRGMMWQQAVTGCIPYELPPDIPDEVTGT